MSNYFDLLFFFTQVDSAVANARHFSVKKRLQRQSFVSTGDVLAAVGCPEVTAPSGGWVRTLKTERANDAVGGREDSVMMRCNDSSETWYLTCTSNHWRGQPANCTHGQHSSHVT